MAEPIVFPGDVAWSGENPGISLKETPDGPFVSLASFFRVMLSPHGRGHALVLAQSPHDAAPPADRANLCLTDTEPLARYLIDGFLSHFGAWKGLPALENLQFRTLDGVTTAGDAASQYSETVRAGDLTVRLTWSRLGAPFCFALPPDKSATGAHTMPSLFVGADEAVIEVNGRRLPGTPVPREIVGRTITTAMLAFSETWLKA